MSEETTKATPKRKPAAKKPPTKAAAMKALGISQAQLDALANVEQLSSQLEQAISSHTASAAAQPVPFELSGIREKQRPMEVPGAEFITTNQTEQITAGEVETSEGVEYKSGYATPTEHSDQAVNLADVQQPSGITKYWVRNCYGAKFSLRLERQMDTHTRTELEPRGYRGDMAPLRPEDLQDGFLARNVNVGALEILTHQEAMRIQSNQLTNADSQHVHTPSSILVNAKGEDISNQVSVMPEFNSQGQVVGYVAAAETRSGNQTSEVIRPGQEAQQGPRSVNGEVRQAYIPQQPGPDRSAAVQDQIARDAKARAKQGESGPGLALPGMAITQGEAIRT